MKKLLIAITILTLSVAAAATIVGTEHDLSLTGTSSVASANIADVCGYCHIPHNSNNATLPLWNHTPSAQVFTVYTSPTNTLNAAVGQPGAGSLQCLGCHDGVTGVGSVVALGGTLYTAADALAAPDNAATVIGGGGLLGTDLSNDHPIGFTYDAALVAADGQLVAPGAIAPARLIGGRVECSSCHSMHRPVVTANILIDSMAGSDLCLNCHVK